MPKVTYTREIGVNMLGEMEYTVLPTCPVCSEWTYGEDTCPFCRMNGVTTNLEYEGSRSPQFFDEQGNEVINHCGVCGEKETNGTI